MLALFRVCADFRNKNGECVFKVTPPMRLTFVEAPEAIREDPLFHLLRKDHLVEVTDEPAKKKKLENDPV